MTSHGALRALQRAGLPLMLSLALAGCGASRGLTTMPDFMGQVFRQADTNHDGVLSPAESGLLDAQFDVVDRNHDGVISLDEWENGTASSSEIQQAYPNFLAMVLTLHHQLDFNNDGQVSLQELVTAQNLDTDRLGPGLITTPQMQSAFSAADANHDGQLSSGEFQNFYMNLGTLPTVGRPKGLFSNVAMTLLGAYINFTARIACHVALHPGRSQFTATPTSAWNIPYQDISFQTPDGLTLRGWYVPAATPTSKCVILMHGRGDNRGMFVRQGQIQWLNAQYNVLDFDLRDHGASDGDAVSYGYHEGDDAIAALNYAKTLGNDEFAYYGISLGAASAIRATALAPEVKACVDDCSYATVASAFEGFCSFDMVPAAVMVGAAAVTDANQELGVDITSTEPMTQVAKIAPRPFLVIHGAADQYITLDNAHINYDGAGDDPLKQLWIVPGARHAMSAQQDPTDYRQRLLDFLQQAM